eukprot:scaffold21405_cov50-Attheya_sp.AAC.2
MVLGTKLIITEQNRNFGTRHQENDEDNKGEPKDVVELVHPKTCHDEEKFHVGGGKWNNTCQCYGQPGIHHWRLFRDGPGNRRDERNGHTAPHGSQNDDVKEWHRCGGVEKEEDDVEKQKDSKTASGEARGSQDSAHLPLTTLERLVETTADVSSKTSTHHVKDQKSNHEGSTAGWVEESHGRKDNAQEGGNGDLHTRPHKDAVEHGVGAGRPKDVGVDKLPARLVRFFVLLLIRELRNGIVASNVALEVPDEDGYHEEGEEEDDEDGVGDGVPVYLGRHHVVLAEVNVPARGPGNHAALPHDVVGVDDLLAGLDDLVFGNVGRGHVLTATAGLERLVVPVRGLAVPLVAAAELVVDAHGLDGKADHAVALVGRSRPVDVNDEVDVVVDVGVLGRGGDEPDGESSGVVPVLFSLVGEADGGGGHVVNDPVVVVAVLDVQGELGSLQLGQLHLAHHVAVHLLHHVDVVGGALDLVAGQELAQVLGRHLGAAARPAKGKPVVVLGQLRVDRGHGVHLQLQLRSGEKGLRLHAWHVERRAAACEHRHRQGGAYAAAKRGHGGRKSVASLLFMPFAVRRSMQERTSVIPVEDSIGRLSNKKTVIIFELGFVMYYLATQRHTCS